MRLILGFVLAFAIGAVCRLVRIPSPVPNACNPGIGRFPRSRQPPLQFMKLLVVVETLKGSFHGVVHGQNPDDPKQS
jgi:hypothetical protein